MKNKITLQNLTCLFFLLSGMLSAHAQIVLSNADDGSPGTLRSVIANASSGSVITFGIGITNIVLTNGEIPIDKSLTVTGNGLANTSINGNSASRIFNITSGNVILNDLTLTNGLADNGGAIAISNAELIINAATISNNVANGASGSGGAIWVNTGGDLSVFNSSISGNRANRAGGGIESVAGTNVTLTNVSLNGNNAGVAPAVAAPGNGGGLHITGAGTAEITGGTVNNNTAAAEGGGLWNGSGTMEITGTTISQNTASGIAADNGGGGIYNLNGGTLTIENATISNNAANGTSGSGGGILNDVGAMLTISDSNISGNTSNRAGGGIENNAGTITLTDVNITGNTTFNSPGNGGGIHITGAGTANITDGTVSNNTAGAEGGGLWNGTGTMTVNGTTISANTASGAGADQGGGGIYNLNGGNLVVTNATITLNVANGTLGSGGGILNDVGSQLSVTDSEISQNSAIRAGGGIEDNSGTSNIILTNVNLDNNTVTGPPGNGGGLHITGGGNATITGGTVNGNTAALEGGGLWNGSGDMFITGTTIDGNIAQGAAADDGGGGIFNNAGELTLSNSVILSNNKATGLSGSGGGLLSLAGSVLTTATFDSNAANRAGGAIEVVNGVLTVSAGMYTDNDVDGGAGTANPGNGGAIHFTGIVQSTINGAIFDGNHAKREGGALWNQTGCFMGVEDVTIRNNTASGPDATHGGGGIFNNGGTLSVAFTTLNDNAANGTAGNGGAIHVKSGTANLMLVTVSGNTAAANGGGIYNNAMLTVNAATIAENTAAVNGGGVAAGALGTTSLGIFKNSLIANNSAVVGQDIFAAADPFTTNGYNIIGEDDASAIVLSIGDVTGTGGNPINIFLAPLADNGGFTQTHRLLANSPAYNAGDPSDLFNDQNGSAVFGGRRDIGSYESQTVLASQSFTIGSKQSIIYPNPSNGQITIELAAGLGNNANGKLIEVASGKTVHEFKVDAKSSLIDLNNFASGVYIVQLESNDTIENHKLVIGR